MADSGASTEMLEVSLPDQAMEIQQSSAKTHHELVEGRTYLARLPGHSGPVLVRKRPQSKIVEVSNALALFRRPSAASTPASSASTTSAQLDRTGQGRGHASSLGYEADPPKKHHSTPGYLVDKPANPHQALQQYQHIPMAAAPMQPPNPFPCPFPYLAQHPAFDVNGNLVYGGVSYAPVQSLAGPQNVQPLPAPRSPVITVETTETSEDIGPVHRCRICGKWRSPAYHARHPLAPGERPWTGPCRKCLEEETSEEETEVIVRSKSKTPRRRDSERHARRRRIRRPSRREPDYPSDNNSDYSNDSKDSDPLETYRYKRKESRDQDVSSYRGRGFRKAVSAERRRSSPWRRARYVEYSHVDWHAERRPSDSRLSEANTNPPSPHRIRRPSRNESEFRSRRRESRSSEDDTPRNQVRYVPAGETREPLIQRDPEPDPEPEPKPHYYPANASTSRLADNGYDTDEGSRGRHARMALSDRSYSPLESPEYPRLYGSYRRARPTARSPPPPPAVQWEDRPGRYGGTSTHNSRVYTIRDGDESYRGEDAGGQRYSTGH